MKHKLVVISFVFIAISGFFSPIKNVLAQSGGSSDTIDLECYRQKLFNPGLDCEGVGGGSDCGSMPAADKKILADECAAKDLPFDNSTCTCDNMSTFEAMLPRTNFDGSIENIPEFVRLLFTVMFMIVAIVAFVVGVIGMRKYSHADAESEDVAAAQKILKDGLIGIVIAVGGIIVVNIIFMFLGLDFESVFTFNIS